MQRYSWAQSNHLATPAWPCGAAPSTPLNRVRGLSLERQAGQECIKGLIHQTGSASRNFYLNEPVLPLEGEVPAEMTAVAWYLWPAHR